MIGHKLPNKTKSATVAEFKKISPTKQSLRYGAGVISFKFSVDHLVA
jgi:hypothetical protein